MGSERKRDWSEEVRRVEIDLERAHHGLESRWDNRDGSDWRKASVVCAVRRFGKLREIGRSALKLSWKENGLEG